MEIPELIKLLSGRNTFNDITLYEAIVTSVDLANRTAICTSNGGVEIEDIEVSLMTTIGDGSYMIPKIGSTVYIMINPLINPFIIHYGEVQTVVLSSTDKVQLNGEEFGGVIKVQELVDKINILEDALNNLITTYNTHTHTSGSSGSPTSPPAQLDSDTITNTTVEDIENPDVTHGAKAEE